MIHVQYMTNYDTELINKIVALVASEVINTPSIVTPEEQMCNSIVNNMTVSKLNR